MQIEVTEEERKIVKKALNRHLMIQVNDLALNIQSKTVANYSYHMVKKYVEEYTEQVRLIETLINKFHVCDL